MTDGVDGLSVKLLGPLSQPYSPPELLAGISLFHFAHAGIVQDHVGVDPLPDLLFPFIRAFPPEFPKQANGFGHVRVSRSSPASGPGWK
jgi:hypothetical protein